MKKTALIVSFAALATAGWWSYNLVWGKPLSFDHFLERCLVKFALLEPELLSMVSVVDNTVLDFHSGKLTGASPDHSYKLLDTFKGFYSVFQQYDKEKLEGQQLVSYEMMDWFLKMELDRERWLFHDFPVNQSFGVQGELPAFMDTYHLIVNEKSARRYISRLEGFEKKLREVSESLIYRADKGIVPPKFVFEHVLKEVSDFIVMAPEENSLYSSFSERVDGIEGVNQESREELLENAAAAIANYVYPGYLLLVETLEGLKPLAKEESGAWTLPDGDEYYRYLVKYHTSLDVEPDEVHNIGLNEVERIRKDMFLIFETLEITEGTVAERFAELDKREGIFYPDNPQSYDKIIEDYTAMIDKLSAKTAHLFNHKPQAAVKVRRVPEYIEATAPFGYYGIPAMDGSRPGIFFINLRDLSLIPKYGMMTLAAHEAVPGHHFQLALQQEMSGVPTIRKVLPFMAFAEGWALYTEQLVAEAGVYNDDPLGDLGRLQSEMLRAVRLVVDTGIHYKRWDLDKAVHYMYENTGSPYKDVVSEIERYVVAPAQAISYKMGMLHILELRQRAEESLGDLFDIRDFHDVLLMNGSLPLEVLSKVIDDYIASN